MPLPSHLYSCLKARGTWIHLWTSTCNYSMSRHQNAVLASSVALCFCGCFPGPSRCWWLRRGYFVGPVLHLMCGFSLCCTIGGIVLTTLPQDGDQLHGEGYPGSSPLLQDQSHMEVSLWLFPFPYYQMVPWLHQPEVLFLLCHAYLLCRLNLQIYAYLPVAYPLVH